MSTPYLLEKVQALLTMALWYARLGNAAQLDKVFTNTVALIENEGGTEDPELNGVLEEYAGSFRGAGRTTEADQLSGLARRIREANPDRFYTDGREIPWWKRPSFLARLSALPVEYKASRAKSPDSSAFLLIGCAGIVLGVFLFLVLSSVLTESLSCAGSLLFLLVVLVFAVRADRRRDRAIRRQGEESWCKLTEEGIEYHEPTQHFNLRWSEIDKVEDSWESGQAEDEIFNVVDIEGGGRKFRLSARFFTEQELKFVEGVCRLKSGAE